ncbi:hypothetical protein [Flagellimonas myxillae]|uniref:hypothetical protein n=1 Tax=Flagellimonas myxillae TaxID=2942214 RepID=UPI00201EE7F4|nr:hypothetical protein [Muricauda myxillae]MCL6264918.1 hypothetical protein [Muricauda myxillae]
MDEVLRITAKDEILKFVLGYDGVNNVFIAKNLFKNKIGSEEVKKLCYEIVEYDKFLLDIKVVKDIIVVSGNDLTKKFLKEEKFYFIEFKETAGKFMKEFKKNEHLRNENELRNLQKVNLKLTNKLNKQKIKTHYIPIVISIISLGFAAYSLFKPSNGVSQKQYDTKIEFIDQELKQLRIEFKQENDELKERLYKAEMQIAIYESDSLLNGKSSDL